MGKGAERQGKERWDEDGRRGDVSIGSLSKTRKNVYSLLYTKAAAALFYTPYLSIRFNGA